VPSVVKEGVEQEEDSVGLVDQVELVVVALAATEEVALAQAGAQGMVVLPMELP
jgi:hypothetical protein